MADMLELGPDLAFPLDVVTQPIAIMGVRRSGKSNAAAVLAEEMFDHSLPWVAIDPKGDWWGLRSSGNGTGPGLPIPIFGGLHGDLPLVPEAGAVMANMIFEQDMTCILDVSRFSIAARSRFLVAFGDRLFELHQETPTPRLIFLEEAHRILPQQVRAEMAHCVGTWTKVIAEGGSFGLGIAILDQRCATVNKDGLTQVEAMIPLRTTSPQDRAAIKDWMAHHHVVGELVDSLPDLASGEAWVSSGYWLPLHGQPSIQRARFRQRRTFDSGATPVVGQRRRPPATLADIDLSALEERMSAMVEQAAQNDPARLRKELAEVRRQLAEIQRRAPSRAANAVEADLKWANGEIERLSGELAEALAREPERVEVPVISLEQYRVLADLAEHTAVVVADLMRSLEKVNPATAAPPPALLARPAEPPSRVGPSARTSNETRPPVVSKAADASPQADSGVRLGKRERAILTVLVLYPAGRTHRQIALLTGYSPKASTIGAGLSVLRKAGYVSPGGNPVLATQAGIEALGDVEPLPSGPALLEYWNGQLGGRERALLAVLLDRYPETVAHAEMAEATGYSPDASTIGAGMSRLRGLGLAEGWMAAPDFVDAIGAPEGR